MSNDPWADAMREIADGEDVEQACDKAMARQTERVRDMIRRSGREDILAEMDQNLKDVRLGLTRARNVWHSISAAQRRVLEIMAEGRTLRPIRHTTGFEGGYCRGLDATGEVCKRPTVRALHSRNLIEPCPDNVFAYTLTEHGRFVLRHGKTRGEQ